MKKCRLLLLDANIVIELFALDLWTAVTERCEVHLGGTILQEARFYVDPHGVRQEISLQTEADAGKISVFEVVPSDLEMFKERFGVLYLEKLDPGEAESLAFMLKNLEHDFVFCSADKIVFRILGSLRLREKGISLEEVLRGIGYERRLKGHYSKAYREQWATKGFQEGFTGQGLNKP